MTARSQTVLLLASALVALALTFLFWESGPALPPSNVDAATRPAPIAVEVAKELTAEAADDKVTDVQRTEVEALVAPPLGPFAHLIGRCVDADGKPLAGCTLDLHGWGANSQRTDAWHNEHVGDSSWQDPDDLVTGADGRFAFAFWPPPPFQFVVRVNKDGCTQLTGRWSQLEEGKIKDVGDVVVTPGVTVRGRVVDGQGVGQGKASVTFSLKQKQRERAFNVGIAADWDEQTRTSADGTFEMRQCLVPGTYELHLTDRVLVSPKTVNLTAERLHEAITVVVGPTPKGAQISGRVVDETGAPAARVEISAFSGDYVSTQSKGDGTFALVARGRLVKKTTRLDIQSESYEAPDRQYKVEWGSTDIEIRVTRRGELLLRVTDDQQQPVTHYSVRMLPLGSGSGSFTDSRVRTSGEHPDGIATLPGLPRGDCMIFVEFPAASGFEMLTTRLNNSKGSSRRLDLVARLPATRTMRLLTKDDTPLAGAQVRLCELFEMPFNAARTIVLPEQWWMNARSLNAMVVFTGCTTADGTLELRGPGNRELGLLLDGKGEVTPLRDVVRLDVRDELVLRCDSGATLKGHCAPGEGLAALHRLAGIEPDVPFPSDTQPSLVLFRVDGVRFPGGQLTYVDKSPLAFTADGTFSASGVPAGNWRVFVSCAVKFGSSSCLSQREIYLTDVTLTSGQTTDLVLDLAKVVPGKLEAQVWLNGLLLPDADVVYNNEVGGSSLKTDGEGRCSSELLSGSYDLRLHQPKVSWPYKVVVRPRETTTVELHFFTGKVCLQVIDPDGKPAAAVPVMLRNPLSFIGQTDDTGQLAIQLEPGSHTFAVLPQWLESPEEHTRLWNEAKAAGRTDWLAPHLLTIGEIVMQANDDKLLKLRLPASWQK